MSSIWISNDVSNFLFVEMKVIIKQFAAFLELTVGYARFSPETEENRLLCFEFLPGLIWKANQ
jgi:hypothetical protein